MILLYAIPLAIVIGLVAGGRVDGLADLRFRWTGVAIAGLLAQVVLFALPPSDLLASVGPALYVLSTAAVLVAVLANLRLPGVPIVALGAAINLVAVVANGGYMPTTATALAAAGRSTDSATFSNSTLASTPVLAPLTDVYAVPAGIPFANVFSIGDVLIGVGILVAIVVAMRRQQPAAQLPRG